MATIITLIPHFQEGVCSSFYTRRVPADLKEGRFQTLVGQRLEHSRRTGPRTVVEGQNDFVVAEKVVLEMLEAETRAAVVSISTIRARPIPPALSHGGIVLAAGLGMSCAGPLGAKLIVPAGAAVWLSCSIRVDAPETLGVSAAPTWASWPTGVYREDAAAL
jgi:hypothetical protein